jgi:hypothetical protein
VHTEQSLGWRFPCALCSDAMTAQPVNLVPLLHTATGAAAVLTWELSDPHVLTARRHSDTLPCVRRCPSGLCMEQFQLQPAVVARLTAGSAALLWQWSWSCCYGACSMWCTRLSCLQGDPWCLAAFKVACVLWSRLCSPPCACRPAVGSGEDGQIIIKHSPSTQLMRWCKRILEADNMPRDQVTR